MPGNGLTGLSNLGNTCYINSCMQILSHTHCLNNVLNNVEKVNNIVDSHLLVEWNNLRNLMWSKDVTISPGRFIKTIQHVAKAKNNDLFTSFDQNDSAEFFIFCIDCFHNALKYKHSIKYNKTENKYMNKGLELTKRTYKQEFSPVHKLFHSILITDITSLKHKSLSIKAEHCLLYSLSFFKQTTHTLYECLDNYFMEEKLEGDNAWLHEKTNKKIPVFKKTYILYSPEIIIIDLKRWVNPYKKIQTLVTTDLTIDLEKYCIVKDNSSVYELYGICNHGGGPMGGHYWAYVLNTNGKWYEFNDTHVKEITTKNIVTSNAYCFFYRKKK